MTLFKFIKTLKGLPIDAEVEIYMWDQNFEDLADGNPIERITYYPGNNTVRIG